MKIYISMMVAVMCAETAFCDKATFSAVVIDAKTGDTLQGVTINAWFENKIGWRAWTESPPYITDTKVTDTKGHCCLVGKTNTGKVSCWVERSVAGYYRGSAGSWTFENKSLFGTWQPDNLVITVALDRVEKPIPLYVKKVVFPNLDKTVNELSEVEKGSFSYDFVKGDWLPPWGQGEVADVVFRRLPREDMGVGVNGRGQRNRSFKDVVAVDFQGGGNGIVAVPVSATSELKIRTSVDSGFAGHYEQVCGRGKDLQAFRMYDEAKCLCFRVRTKYDDKGKVVEAFYGKIYGDIAMGWSYQGVSSVSFLYYFNPTPNDRNLEWDRKNNLCDKPGKLEISVNHTPMLLP